MLKKTLLLSTLVALIQVGFAQQKNDWANFGKYESANIAVKALPASQRKVVFMGNSITEGWVKADSSFFKDNGFIGRGISGQVTSQMLVRFRQDVIALQPQAVVILAGTNDIAENQGPISLENIFGNIVSMIELAKFHKIKVIVSSVLPASEYRWRPGMQPAIKIPKLNAMLEDYCKKNKVVYADYFKKMANADNGLDEELSKDGVHPTLAGYKIMESVILPLTKSVAR
ncbi:MAG: acylhydrolase [Pseudopedobacter saltans]|uniref:Acylhydrolase n=1 Tax=Pseudopedobacter saltans TaxID=151895 RepID=A0A2W5F6L5_9SPHI|nr:MAG: acylhydrolase [Pseudopedobacter saltans]